MKPSSINHYKFLMSVPRAPVGRVINYFSCAQGEISTIIEAGKKTDFRR